MGDFKELKDIIPILIFLLPGFLTGKMLDLLVVAKQKDVFDRIVQAFVFTFINLLCFSVVRWLLESFSPLTFDRVQFFTVGNLLITIFCAVGIALACSYEVRNERLINWLREKRITKKGYKPSTWLETFENEEKYVVVHLNDGRRVYGWPSYYSDEPNERAIYLVNASWLDDQNNFMNSSPISILLDEKTGIQFVEFLP